MTSGPPDDRKRQRASVIASELAWHENEVQRRNVLGFLYASPAFDAVVEAGLAFVQAQPDEPVLDMGCGAGDEPLALAEVGARVIATDLSVAQIVLARQHVRAHYPDAQVCFVQANAEEMPLVSGAVRVIYGKAILHHLDLDLAAAEVSRLLQPGGRASFAEPMARHPLFWLARRLSPRLRTADEHPLTYGDLHRFARSFESSHIKGVFLFAPLAYIFRFVPGGEPLFRRCHSLLLRLDEALLSVFPLLRELTWYGIVNVEKRGE